MLLREEGDMFDFNHQAYAQGVSNLGLMGRGIAVDFKNKYPQMFKEYKELCRNGELNPGDLFFYQDLVLPDVINLVTQDNLLHANKSYLRESIKKMFVLAKRNDIKDIAMPEIGCGLGKLDFSDLEDMLQPFIGDSNSTVTIYSLKQPKV
ncbi:phosphatase [Candidatus Woesearchaeota archaeon]|jgi:O-acetyl-ADP-ribose deacetylase (regulator of RNase III)|nr:phosphatase [Candidatus Woesearchaeota archaeon]